MAKQTINIGSVAGDGTGDPLRTAFDKTNDNFTELYDGLATANSDISGKQPLDAQLTSLAGLVFTSNGSKVVRINSGATAFEVATLAKADVGLDQVDNTSDANKPVSTATQTALDGKQALDATLTAFAALSWSSGVQVPTFTAADTISFKTVGSSAGNLLDKTAGDALYQPLDAQLTSLATLSYASNGSKVVRVNSGASDFELANLVKGDVGLGNVDNTSDDNKPVSTATQAALDSKQDKQAITVDSTTARTLSLGDAGDFIRFTNGSAVTVTVPTNASVAFAIGTIVWINQAGAGTVTVSGDGGVTVEMLAGKTGAMPQYGISKLIKVATNTWTLSGDLS